jgi:hypothetical protein
MHGVAEEEYEAMWAETTESVATPMPVRCDEPKLYHRAAFVVSPECASRLVVSD